MPVRLPFDFALGASQGRITPTGTSLFDGSKAFVLGDDRTGILRKLNVGDFVDVEQTGDLTGIDVVRARAHVRAVDLPGDLSWQFSLLLDGAAVWTTALYRELDLVDLAIPIGAATGDHRIGFRLALAGTAGTYEVELPAVYIDSVALDTVTTGVAVVNRDPGDEETDVPVNRSIRFDIIDVAGTSAITVASTKVYVSNVLAFDGGVFQTGFTGTESAQDPTVHGGFGLRLTIDPTTSFASDEIVSVRVVSASGNGALDTVYAFACEDVAAPTITSAVATERKTLRVTFSEDVVQGDGTAANDALNPDNYTIALSSTSLEDGLPAVGLAVVSVAIETSRSVVLTTDIEHTPAALYTVAVVDVEDLSGNPVVAPNNTAMFTGFVPAVPAGRRFDISEFVPDMNLAEDETLDLTKFLACLQEVVDLLVVDIDRWTNIIDVDVAPEVFVDGMLADLGNPFDFELSLTDKRRLARILVPIYRQKGTAQGIINAIRFFLGVEVTLTYPAFAASWVLGESELGIDTVLTTTSAAMRYSYRIVSPVVLSDEQRTRATKLATYMHVAHEHLLGIDEPTPPPPEPDHWEIGLSELGTESFLH